MKPSKTLILLTRLVIILTIAAAASGLFWPAQGNHFTFTTLHGSSVEMSGQGLYHFDTLFKVGILRGTDAVTLFVAVPLLILALMFAGRGSVRGKVFLMSMLAYFLYYAAYMAFGVAYNQIVLIYLLLFSCSLFAFIISIAHVNSEALMACITPHMPRKGTAVFLIIAGCSVLVWLPEIIAAAVSGQIPVNLGTYTTEVTYFIDLGVIAPTAILAAVLLFKQKPLGYLLAPILLTVNALIGLIVIAQTIGQSMSGILLNPVQLVVYVGIFVVLSVFAILLDTRFFKSIQPMT